MPATCPVAAARSPIATATASSSSSSSGGSAAPAPEPVAGHARRGVDRVAEIAQLVDVAADGPDVDAQPFGQRRYRVQSRGVCSSESSRSSRAEVSSMLASLSSS